MSHTRPTTWSIWCRWSSAARRAGARVIVLPELASSGYAFASREEAFAAADAVPEGDAPRAWVAAAQRLNVYMRRWRSWASGASPATCGLALDRAAQSASVLIDFRRSDTGQTRMKSRKAFEMRPFKVNGGRP